MAKAKPKARLYEGNIPEGGLLLQTFGDWCLFGRSKIKEFYNVKLVHIGERVVKANFHLCFNTAKNKFVINSDYRTLAKNDQYKTLHDEALNWLVANALAQAALATPHHTPE